MHSSGTATIVKTEENSLTHEQPLQLGTMGAEPLCLCALIASLTEAIDASHYDAYGLDDSPTAMAERPATCQGPKVGAQVKEHSKAAQAEVQYRVKG